MNNPLIDSMSHKDMDSQFERECDRFGWKCYHTHDSRKSREGWPDWVASNGAHTIFAEFKTAKDKLTKDQYSWLTNLLATGHRAYVVRPANFGKLIELIMRGSTKIRSLRKEHYSECEFILTVATQQELANCKWRK